MEQKSILAKLEERFVFRTSRFFFLILVLLAMLGTMAGGLLLLWGIIPTSKQSVAKDAEPTSVTLTVADITQAMNAPATKDLKTTESVQPSADETKKAEVDSAQLQFQLLLDTLQTLLPGSIYSWESEGHWSYPYGKASYNYSHNSDYRDWITDKPGITDKLKEFYSGLPDVKVGVASLGQLCSILRAFPENDRLKPFNTFVDLFAERHAEYQRKLKENEDAYQSRLSEADSSHEFNVAAKSAATYQGLIAMSAGIASVAFLAIFLVLLSMQRSMKQLVASASARQ